MIIYLSDFESGNFKLGDNSELVIDESMCAEVLLPNPKKTLMGKLFNRDIKKCIPSLKIYVERGLHGVLQFKMHPSIFKDLQEILNDGHS